MFMTYAAWPGTRSLTIRQIAHTGLIRMRHGWVARVEHSALPQKDEAVMVRTIEWRRGSTRRIIEICHPQKIGI